MWVCMKRNDCSFHAPRFCNFDCTAAIDYLTPLHFLCSQCLSWFVFCSILFAYQILIRWRKDFYLATGLSSRECSSVTDYANMHSSHNHHRQKDHNRHRLCCSALLSQLWYVLNHRQSSDGSYWKIFADWLHVRMAVHSAYLRASFPIWLSYSKASTEGILLSRQNSLL